MHRSLSETQFPSNLTKTQKILIKSKKNPQSPNSESIKYSQNSITKRQKGTCKSFVHVNWLNLRCKVEGEEEGRELEGAACSFISTSWVIAENLKQLRIETNFYVKNQIKKWNWCLKVKEKRGFERNWPSIREKKAWFGEIENRLCRAARF